MPPPNILLTGAVAIACRFNAHVIALGQRQLTSMVRHPFSRSVDSVHCPDDIAYRRRCRSAAWLPGCMTAVRGTAQLTALKYHRLRRRTAAVAPRSVR